MGKETVREILEEVASSALSDNYHKELAKRLGNTYADMLEGLYRKGNPKYWNLAVEEAQKVIRGKK